MLTVEEAHEQVLAHVELLGSEAVPIPLALGRVLAGDAIAHEMLPGFANSAMDGYAVHAEDTAGASSDHPVRFKLIGEVPAGSVFSGGIAHGEAVRILTGAPVPETCDAVLQQELAHAGADWVEFLAAAAPGNNIRYPGEDVRVGDVLVRGGTELGPAEIALLAALGVHPVTVTRRPRVAILSTGDELAPLGTVPQPGQIRESNGPYLAAAVLRAGAEPVMLGIARDRSEEIRAALEQAKTADLILTSGGVSVGDYDLVKQILQSEGDIEFWRVRMRPGKPLAFGRLGTTPLLGLPGNPVSAAVTFELFGRPAIRRMLGCRNVDRPAVQVVYDGSPMSRGDRRHYVRVRLHSRDATLVAQPTGDQASHVISSLRGATALLIVPEGEGDIQPGERLTALLLNDGLPWADE